MTFHLIPVDFRFQVNRGFSQFLLLDSVLLSNKCFHFVSISLNAVVRGSDT